MAAKRQRKSIVLRILVLCVCVYMVVTLCGLWRELISDRNSLKALQAQRDEKAMQINELMNLLDSGDDTKIIEKAARERLGYVYADEQVYIDISGN